MILIKILKDFMNKNNIYGHLKNRNESHDSKRSPNKKNDGYFLMNYLLILSGKLKSN